jgi:vanillate/4-hydroxybenzoate decarboxylase subunit D
MRRTCPRCAHDVVDLLCESPVAGAWEVLQCQRCLYGWRTSEPARRIDADVYPDSFRMTPQQIHDAPEVPRIFVLRSRS